MYDLKIFPVDAVAYYCHKIIMKPLLQVISGKCYKDFEENFPQYVNTVEHESCCHRRFYSFLF